MKAIKRLFGLDGSKETHTVSAANPHRGTVLDYNKITSRYEVGEIDVTENRVVRQSERTSVEVTVPGGKFVYQQKSTPDYDRVFFEELPVQSNSRFEDLFLNRTSKVNCETIKNWVTKEKLVNPECYSNLFPILCAEEKTEIRSILSNMKNK